MEEELGTGKARPNAVRFANFTSLKYSTTCLSSGSKGPI